MTDKRNQLFDPKNITKKMSTEIFSLEILIYRSTEVIKCLVALVKFENYP